MTPHRGNTILFRSSQSLVSISDVASETTEIQGHRQVWLTLTQTLIVRLLKTHLFSLFQKLGALAPHFTPGRIYFCSVLAISDLGADHHF